MPTSNTEADLARKLVNLMGRQPELSADICGRLEYARHQAMNRYAHAVVNVGAGSAALSQWGMRRRWLAIATATLALCAAFVHFSTAEQPFEGASPSWTYHSEAESAPPLENVE